MKKEINQVKLSKLVFAQNWEDPRSDQLALQIKSNDVVQAVTSGGCNVLGFLLYDPKRIYSVDINPAQTYMLELKMEAIRHLKFDEFICFAGLDKCIERLSYYQRIRSSLSTEGAAFWDKHLSLLNKGFLMTGKYERFILMAGKFISFLQGKKKVHGLFENKTLAAQQHYFEEVWNTRRFRYLFELLFNKHMLARRGLVAGYFTFDDGSTSFAESFYNRSKKAFCQVPIAGNYFFSLYLLGCYLDKSQVPAYLQPQHFDTIKSRLDRISNITAGVQAWIDQVPDQTIDCYALSNICELMSESETLHLFEAVARTATPGARVILRNLIIPRDIPPSLRSTIIHNQILSKQLYDEDRSFVYGKVAAYHIRK